MIPLDALFFLLKKFIIIFLCSDLELFQIKSFIFQIYIIKDRIRSVQDTFLISGHIDHGSVAIGHFPHHSSQEIKKIYQKLILNIHSLIRRNCHVLCVYYWPNWFFVSLILMNIIPISISTLEKWGNRVSSCVIIWSFHYFYRPTGYIL